MANTKIYSMASNDVVVATYKPKKDGEVSENKMAKSIIIKGKANVRDPKTLQTPKWAVTDVSAEELKVLEANPSFKRKVDAGYIVVGKEPTDFKKDKSAQMTEGDVKVKNAKATAKTNGEGEE
ncbi:hypothetical protein PP411_gp67 [Vibrio phage vB_VpP_BT-1011]|uniref:Uncharacterized protein n=1 Tax=Vibrio phage vB_VpP_BT-1011 TaxID=2799672 RepID=A0A8F3BEJ8_9CAUD|nr:hypothetical protein PP411_gp67 [Vibrio phage vB_VpP_BT-1011]QWX10266.1 hypothetical protein vBVpPBT1011_0067 [Vibrio phage vB_VpP_BT-1011]